MRRPAADLYDRITSFETLWWAARQARRGKRRSPATAAFEHRLEPALLSLRQALRSGRFRFGGYREFTVREPVPRTIRAAPYRDRVVHHAICRYLEPLLDRRMIADSYACRVARGTHRALDRLQHFLQTGSWVLKLDIRKCFYCVDHELLLQDLRRVTSDPRLLALLRQLLATYDAGPDYYFPQPGDDLWSPFRARGLPIGNLTSQLFANAFLTPIDQFVKRDLHVSRYLRYMDDLILVGTAKRQVQGWLPLLVAQLGTRRLVPHPIKTQILPSRNGVPFLGFRVYAHRRRVLRANLRRFTRRMRRYASDVATGAADLERVRRSLAAWLGFVPPARHTGLIERILRGIPFRVPGHRLPMTWTVTARAPPG